MTPRADATRGNGIRALIAGLAILVGGCANVPTLAPPASLSAGSSSSPAAAVSGLPAGASDVPTTGPSDGPIASDAPAPTDSNPPETTPTPTRPPLAPATGWTKPGLVGTSLSCGSVDAGIDGSDRLHVASDCGSGITYGVASPGGAWKTTFFASPAGHPDLGPKLAFDGGATYLAYYQVGEGGCGGPADTGVYYRVQATPGGAWSAPTRIGTVGDGLMAFAESGGYLYATVVNDASYFESVHGSQLHRYKIAEALGGIANPVSLQLGQDGKPRIAYGSGGLIDYGLFNGSGFTTTTVYHGAFLGWGPTLVLGKDDAPVIVWTHSPSPGGCAIGEGSSQDGTYYATLKGGAWSSVRFTTDIGNTSFQLNPGTGAVYACVQAPAGFDLFTRSPSGTWTGTNLAQFGDTEAVIRRDSTSGRLLVAFIASSGDGPAQGLYVMTKSSS